ncbi:hypothetical protein KPL70_014118 [Citrus sinensis]|nr:hypothetical protein KPL70_014118 [Citrus sinensis]
MRSLLSGETDSLKCMPIGILRLTNLLRLDKFVVGGGPGNASYFGDAMRLEFAKMKNLLLSKLSFDGEDRKVNDEDEQLLEALHPPPSLEELGILYYRGSIFPNSLISLTNLRTLKIRWGKNCEHLPALGKLQSLEKLTISDLRRVKTVGNEFLELEGSTDYDPSPSSSSSSSSSVTAFPKFKSLFIWKMSELVGWDYRITRKDNNSIMPRLSFMDIGNCPNMKKLPNYLLQTTTMQRLKIRNCPLLQERDGEGEDWRKISHIPHLRGI